MPPQVYSRKFWSQNAEDILVSRLLSKCPYKFYIDVGCNHPYHDNNTFLFYKQGWRGVNIDANPENINLCNRFRKKDINVCSGVALEEGSLTYYMLSPSTLNTFDEGAAKLQQERGHPMINQEKVSVKPLSQALTEALGEKKDISFMSIDIEGYDMQALKSNDWERFRPKVILLEINDLFINDANKNKMVQFLESQNYAPYLKTINNWIFVDMNRFIKKEHSNTWWKDEAK